MGGPDHLLGGHHGPGQEAVVVRRHPLAELAEADAGAGAERGEDHSPAGDNPAVGVNQNRQHEAEPVEARRHGISRALHIAFHLDARRIARDGVHDGIPMTANLILQSLKVFDLRRYIAALLQCQKVTHHPDLRHQL